MSLQHQSNLSINACSVVNNPQSLLLQSNTFSSSNNSFINNVGTSLTRETDKTLYNSTVSELNDDVISTEFHTQIPLFFINKRIIKVPSKIPYAITRHTPKPLLRAIHPNTEVAIDMCLIFLTQLNSTYFAMREDSTHEGWKALRAEYLRELLSFDPKAYKRITEALEYPLKNGAILECDHKKVVGEKCFHYRIGATYINKGIKEYEVKTTEAMNVLNRHYFRILSEANQNPICKNLIRMYADIVLPTKKQILNEAKRLVKEEYKTKKGKRLVFLNKHSRSSFKNPEQLSFVEDGIEIFDYLTNNGLMIPSVGDEKSGGRVVDSFTLMPSWIRRLVKFNNKKFHECDYSALHPNIAISLYGGVTKHLKHGDLVNELGLDMTSVKVEHLSFFNKAVYQMRESALYKYYESNEPMMLQNIVDEKYSSIYKHRITSRRMFAKEVEIMTEVVKRLNSEGIYVLYVYDALLCVPKNTRRVLEVMDEVALKHEVYTTAKFSNDKKHNPLTANVKDSVLDRQTLEALKLNKVGKS